MLSFYPSHDDQGIEDVLAGLDGGAAGLPWPDLGAGLGCPDDPLDDVMDCLKALDDGFLDALGMGAGGSPPPPRPGADADGGEVEGALDALAVVSVPEVPEDFDVDMFFADSAPDDVGGGGGLLLAGGASSNVSCHAAVTSALPPANPCRALAGVAASSFAPPFPARDALDVVPHDSAPPLPAHGVAAPGWSPVFPVPDTSYGVMAPYFAPTPGPDLAPLLPAHHALVCAVVPDDTKPPLPAHDAVAPALPPTTSSMSSGCCVSSTTFETDSPPRVVPPTWAAVPRRKRHRPVTRRNPRWLPKSRLHATAKPEPVAAAPKKPGGGKKKPAGAARQRNRQRERACSHCGTTETPQWRAGPRGPGTLCNACGIRFKQNKGVLFDEYRPCTSPTFQDGKHSNRQRKVDKLRERKEQLLRQLVVAQAVAVPPLVGGEGGEFMDVCTYIATG